jgi:prolyl oligopeptidase
MSRRVLVWVVVLLVAAGCKGGQQRAAPRKGRGLAYPATRTVDHVDEYHGRKVRDPYRWLEDDNAEETKAWVAEQNKLTFDYLGRIRARQYIRERMEALINYERYRTPVQRGGRYFFRHNDGLQDQDVLYLSEGLDGERKLLIDPVSLSEDGTVALVDEYPSPDGRLLAYALSRSGSDWREFRVRDVATGEDLATDRLQWIKFSQPSWRKDGTGFFYARPKKPAPGKERTAVTHSPTVYYHEVGRPQEHDVEVYARPDQPDWYLWPWLSDDGRYLMLYVSPVGSRNNGIFYMDVENEGPVVEALKDFDATYYPLDNDGAVWWVLTDKGAPKKRIVKIDLRDPRPEAWQEIVPEAAHSIEDASVVGDRLVIHYLRRAHSYVRLFHLDGRHDRDLDLPIGSVDDFTGRRADREMFFLFSSFTIPRRVYRYDFDRDRLEVWRQAKTEVDPGKFVTRQVVYQSKDGTAVTMFISHRKGLKRNGKNAALLYGYGGFNASQRPRYSTSSIVWMEMGGVHAIANLRGGGEQGKAWHEGGVREKKQNVFDDFIAAAEALVYNKYTSRKKLAIIGGSNGGLLVGACMTQRPDLFGACLPAVGVMDMLRFHNFTAGRGWISEYGSSDDPEMFPVLLSYSPYHNLRPGTAYPATLTTTADHDDRVVPAHSFKFAARLQACQAGRAPVLIRVETQGGHGGGTALSKHLDETADVYAFLAKNLGMKVGSRFWRKK